ncbi:MAG: hypothetical protein R3F54_05200 [Alphaproteobacteria bacterium]
MAVTGDESLLVPVAVTTPIPEWCQYWPRAGGQAAAALRMEQPFASTCDGRCISLRPSDRKANIRTYDAGPIVAMNG